MREVYRVLGIQTVASTAYHVQTDGHTERANQEVEVLLQALIKEDQSNWAAMLPLVQFAMNNHSIRSSDITPFWALHRYKLAPIPELILGEQVPEADKFLSGLWETWEKLRKVLLDAQTKDKDKYDQHVCEPDYYKPGDLVYLDSRNLPLRLPTLKLGPKSVGPFLVTEKVGTSAYRLVLPPTWKVHPVFNETLLQPFRGDPSKIRPPPELKEGGEFYEVDKILAKRKCWGKVQYLVSWVGYPPEENTWELLSNLGDAKEAIALFVQEDKT